MEMLGKKGNARKKIRALEALAIARANGARALSASGVALTNAAAIGGAGVQVPAFDTPAQFTGGGDRARTYLVLACITTSTANAQDLTGVVQLRINGAPISVIPQAPIGLAPGGSTDNDLRRCALFWIITLAANPGVITTNSFGIQSDIGGGNTHVIPAGAAEVLVTQIA